MDYPMRIAVRPRELRPSESALVPNALVRARRSLLEPGKWKEARWGTANDRIQETEQLLEQADNLRRILPHTEVIETKEAIEKISKRLPQIREELFAASGSQEQSDPSNRPSP